MADAAIRTPKPSRIETFSLEISPVLCYDFLRQVVRAMIVYLTLIDEAPEKSKFERVYLEYRGLMYYVANRILNNPQDAEDAVHNAFVKIANNISKISEPVCPKTKVFVVTIVEHTAIDLYRKKRRKESMAYLEEITGFEADLPGKSALAACMGKLPIRYRQVILLKYIYGFTNQEAAKIMDTTASNVSKLDQRAKSWLQELCQEEGITV